MEKSSLMLVLHAHLPFVRHPEHEYFLEELWFYEAVLETYLPLLDMLHRLAEDGVSFRLTLSLSPTVLEMLSDPLLNDRLLRHIDLLLELAEQETRRTRNDSSIAPLARMYHKKIKQLKQMYITRFRKKLTAAFGELATAGTVEFITTAATHAYLPNLSPHPVAVAAQVRAGLDTFTHHMGFAPQGIWLPECGYYRGLDGILAKTGVEFCFLETHGLLHAYPKPRHGVFRPIWCPSGVAAFGRDNATARKVWCAQTGYPGHPDYRDFYRDIGYDLPLDYIGRFIHPDGIRVPTGIKYYRVTGRTVRKLPYVREQAVARAREHALDFIAHLRAQARELGSRYGFSPLVVAPYDAELFGHWWYEGIDWLESLLRELAAQDDVRPVAPSEYLGENPGIQTVAPQLSSWGNGGYSQTWADRDNAWAVADILRACGRMGSLARHPSPPPLQKRALDQALRELLLAQSSDWTFLMHRDTHAEYARGRLTGHLENFRLLDGMITEGRIDEEKLSMLEERHGLFPATDYRTYARSLA